MKAYFIRRLLLLPITLFGITAIVFLITRVAPGGPNPAGLSDDDIETMEEEFGIDKHVVYAYFQWLGVLPREDYISKAEYKASNGVVKLEDGREVVRMVVKGEDRIVEVVRNGDVIEKAVYLETGESVEENGWSVRLETPEDRKLRKEKRGKSGEVKASMFVHRAVLFRPSFSGLIQGDFRNSKKFQDPVISMIADKVPISLYFGILSSMIIYGVSIPLGILKAIKHRTYIDNVSSVLIF